MVTKPTTPLTPAEVLQLLDRHTDALVGTVTQLSASDLGGWSRCEHWTRGHVVAHLARNAEAIERLTRWARTGEPDQMYPGGASARDSAIEDGAGRSRQQQLDDLRDTAQSLRPLLAELVLDGAAVEQVEGRGGVVVPSAGLPMMRLREVAFHHVDLDRGFEFTDLDESLLGAFLDDAVRRHAAAGLSLQLVADDGAAWTLGDGRQRVTGTRAGLLRWLTRRDPTAVHSDHTLPEIPRGN